MTWQRAFGVFLALCLVASASTAAESEENVSLESEDESHVGLGIGFPDLFSFQYTRPVTSTVDLGISFGALPTFFFQGIYPAAMDGKISDRYRVGIAPVAQIFSFAWLADWHAFSWPARLQFQLGIVRAGLRASASLKNVETGEAVPIAQIESTLFQPFLSVRYHHTLLEASDGTEVELGLGAVFLPDVSMATEITGSAPAYLDVVPEWRDSITDGVAESEKQMTELLRQWRNRPSLLPTFQLQVRW